VFTGQTDSQEGLNMLRLGAHDYLDKSHVNKDNLSRSIRYGIERAKGYRLQQALHSEQQMSHIQSDFISVVSHEFKTPINTINHSTHAIKQAVKDQLKTVGGYISNIGASNARMDRLVEQMTRFSTFDPSQLSVNRKAFSLFDELQKQIDQFEKKHPDREFRIGCSLADMPQVYTDKRLCNQILEHVIENAVKFSKGEENINFLFSTFESAISLQIQDHGRGIPEDELSQIGNKFFRASNSEDTHGAGMGLYTVRLLMPVLSGDFHIQSRENVGTVVTLTFPLAK